MSKNYLTLEDRKKIKEFLDQNYSKRKISLSLNRCQSVIYFEIEKNGGREKYNPEEAQKNHEKKIKEEKSKRLNLEDRKKIKELLLNGDTKMEIWKKTGFGKSTIYKEIKKNEHLYYPKNHHQECLKKISIKKSQQTEHTEHTEHTEQLQQRIEVIEMHLEILIQTVKELINAKT